MGQNNGGNIREVLDFPFFILPVFLRKSRLLRTYTITHNHELQATTSQKVIFGWEIQAASRFSALKKCVLSRRYFGWILVGYFFPFYYPKMPGLKNSSPRNQLMV